MKYLFTLMALFWGVAVMAQTHDVVIIGEIHDNPAHHQFQARQVADLTPKAIVFEMIAPKTAYGVRLPQFSDPDGLEAYLGWEASGWPDFAMYKPIFAAAPDAKIYGAHVPRAQVRAIMEQGIAAAFGDAANQYGLDNPLPDPQHQQRVALQIAAHCGAIDTTVAPVLIGVQRYRDAVLARAVVQALRDTGGPVAVITGNGHARRDWGIPSLLATQAPDVQVLVIGQTEDDQPLQGGFDQVISAPGIDRPDPCLAFQ